MCVYAYVICVSITQYIWVAHGMYVNIFCVNFTIGIIDPLADTQNACDKITYYLFPVISLTLKFIFLALNWSGYNKKRIRCFPLVSLWQVKFVRFCNIRYVYACLRLGFFFILTWEMHILYMLLYNIYLFAIFVYKYETHSYITSVRLRILFLWIMYTNSQA